MNKIKCKICGLKTKEAVQTASEYGADFIGFIFFEKSSRNISPQEVKTIITGIDKLPKTVAVTVNPSDKFLDDIFKHFTPDYIQLHGEEPPERVKEVKQKYNIKIIKAIPVATKEDVEKAAQYNNAANMILFDTKSETEKGGTGRSFDWGLLQPKNCRGVACYAHKKEEQGRSTLRPYKFFLSGGLNISNLKEAIETTGAEFVDISSGVEKEKGVKDIELMKQTLKFLKQPNNEL